MQAHVGTRNSTQARSHAQKFFVKLDKNHLTLDEFLEGLDLQKLATQYLQASKQNSTDYDEDAEIIELAWAKISVMNIALP